MSGHDDPVQAVADILDRLDEHIARAGVVAGRDEDNRINLLTVHAVIGALIGPLFTPDLSGPAWLVLRDIPGAPLSLAVIISSGGVILLPAVMARSLRWETVGLGLMIVWYLLLALGFAAATGIWIAHGSPAASKPALYAPLVYLHLAIIMAVHLRTLQRAKRQRR